MEIPEGIQLEVVAQMHALARVIDEVINEKAVSQKDWGFALLVFPFDPAIKSRMNYISNAERPDMLAAMQEFIARNLGTYVEQTEAKQ